MNKYVEQSYIGDARSVTFLALGRKVGLTERINAVRAMHPDVVVSHYVIASMQELFYFAPPDAELFVILTNSSTVVDYELVREFSKKVTGAIIVIDYTNYPSYSEEYENYLRDVQLILPDLIDLLPETHPKKQALIVARQAFSGE